MLFSTHPGVNLIFGDSIAIISNLMGAQELRIITVTPSMGLPGGVVSIGCRGYRPGLPSESRVLAGEIDAEVVSASEELVIVRLPDSPNALGLTLSVGGVRSALFPFNLGSRLATDLHPVANPVIAADGSVITTISGSRGQQVPQPLVRITRRGVKVPYPCEVMNPTGLAFGPDGQLYISSRSEGAIYRYTDYERLETFAENLGVCCGIAFDSAGTLYAGDRTGKVYRIDPSGNPEEFARLEPSISAYHLAVDSSDNLYVTGPTISVRDSLYRIDKSGKVTTPLSGLARPQGLAFAPDGALWIAASYGGKKGVFRYLPAGRELTHHVAAPMLVGLAIDSEDVFVVDGSSVYWLQTGAVRKKVS
jgi:sugar lactone lactonase YvrE